MRKFKVLLKQSLRIKFKKKSFYISSIIIFGLVLALTILPGVVIRNGDLFKKQVEVSVYSENSALANQFVDEVVINDTIFLNNYQFNVVTTIQVLEPVSDFVILNLDKHQIITIDDTTIPPSDLFLMNQLNVKLQEQQILNDYPINPQYLQASANIEQLTINNLNSVVTDNLLLENKATVIMILSYIGFIPIFILLILITQAIGLEIADEKSSRGMEILISNVSTKIHMLAKVASGLIYVIVQLLIIIFGAIIGFLISNGLASYAEASQTDNVTDETMVALLNDVFEFVTTPEFL